MAAIIIDALYLFKELCKLGFVVATSPFAIIAGMLVLGTYEV